MMTVEERKEYFKRYYQENKEHCRKLHDDWIEKHKGDFVYFHINEDGKTLYIGSFYSRPLIERQSFLNYSKNELIKIAENEELKIFNTDKYLN